MNTPTNGGDSAPLSYAQARLRTCGRIISLAPDKLSALSDLACGFARDIRCGYLSQQAVADRLHELADAYGLIAEHGIDVVQRAIARNMESESAPTHAWQALSHEAVPTSNPLGGPVTTLDVDEFLAREFQPRDMMFAPWLPTQGIAMIHAERGIGKTHVALGTAWAIHVGARFLRWTAPQPRRVLLLDGEMPAVALKERLARIAELSEYPAQRANLKIAAPDLTRDGLPDLSDPAAQRLYSKVVEDADLVIVDNISALCRMMKENDAGTWMPVQNWALQLRRAGKSVILIHHAGKSGRQRGTSRKEDVLDTIIGLRRPPDYSPDQGARFEVYYEKSRGFYGEDAKPFEAWLMGDRWAVGPIKAGENLDIIKSLKEQGRSVREIAKRTGLSKSTVQRKLNDHPADD
jgi:putative DNA primase/helicase